MRPRTVALTFAMLLAGGVALAVHDAPLLRRAEGATIDARYQLRKGHPDPKIVLVTVDDVTFGELQDRGQHSQWPFPRRYHAQVIDTLRRAGAQTIAVGIQFTEP